MNCPWVEFLYLEDLSVWSSPNELDDLKVFESDNPGLKKPFLHFRWKLSITLTRSTYVKLVLVTGNQVFFLSLTFFDILRDRYIGFLYAFGSEEVLTELNVRSVRLTIMIMIMTVRNETMSLFGAASLVSSLELFFFCGAFFWSGRLLALHYSLEKLGYHVLGVLGGYSCWWLMSEVKNLPVWLCSGMLLKVVVGGASGCFSAYLLVI